MTLGAIKARITDELVRPDLSSQIALTINEAIAEAATNRFWFNEVRGVPFTTVAGQSFYDGSEVNFIPWLARIDALWLLVNGQRRDLALANALDIESWQQGSSLTGEPSAYARQANGIVLWMTPSQVWLANIDGVTRFAPLVLDSDTNPYLEEGERYVRAIAKAMVLEDVVRDFGEADRQWAVAERQKRILLAETTGRLATQRNAAFV